MKYILSIALFVCTLYSLAQVKDTAAVDSAALVKYVVKPSGDGFEVYLSAEKPGQIRFTTDGSAPEAKSAEYKKPIKLTATSEIRAALYDGKKRIGKFTSKQVFVSLASNKPVKFNKAPDEKFQKLKESGLVNGVLESPNGQRDLCTGWKNDDANFTVDLGEAKQVKKVTLYFLQDGKNFIIQPKTVTVYYGVDDSRFEIAGKSRYSYSGEDYMKIDITFEPFTSSKVKIRAENPGRMTAGKSSHNNDFWIMLDEVVIE